ncbi:uncharacterized protein LOC135496899 isoform X5 [Lineus longissimus]|uniref:uncharacterized protein LOC135496899 isoform X5 n=1 Tax=Lineus longissimus TaxID=88925 RepID=UPI00315C8FD7
MAIDIFIVSCACILLSAPLVHLIVPPKTPVLSGFGTAAVGSYRELVCDASQPDAGTITYKWYKYSVKYGVENWEHKGPIGTSQKYIFNPVTEKKVFHGVTEEYVKGKYKCRASNSAGTRDSEWGDLFFYKPCSLYNVSVSPPKPAPGSTFILNCYIPNPKGLYVRWYKWADALSAATYEAGAYMKECLAPSNPRYSWSSCSPPSISSPTKTFNLQVSNAQPSASGYWRCQDNGLSCYSNPVKLVVQAPPGTPQVTGFPSGQVIAGAQLNLKCVAWPPGDTYDWYKDGTKVTTSLTYDFQVTKESAGVYKCVARNGVVSASSTDKTLVVYYKPDSVVVSSGKTSSHVGEKDNFTCTVSGGNPTPTVKIYLKRSGGALVEVTQGQDRVMAKEDNQAEYYCEAKVTGYPVLDMTSSRKTYNVTFNPSKITLLRKPPTVIDEGKLITIICETNSANPVANVTFHRKRKGGTWEQLTSGITSEDRAAEYNGRIRKSTLVVTANRLVTQAVFKCEVRDGLFQMEQTTTVKVYSVPTFTITRNGRLVTVVFVPQIREYTSFQLKFCGPSQTPKTSGCGGVRFTIHDPTTSTYRVIVTHETTIYVFYMDLYIGDDVVYSSGQVHPEQAVPAGSSPDGGMIAGVVVAVVILVAMVVVVVVVLHGRSMACFAGRNKPEESNQDAERTGTTKPVSVCDQPPYKDVVYSALEGEDTQPEPVYLNYPQQDSVKEVIYDNPKVIEKPSGEDTPRKVEDMSVHDFKQWLLSNRVTESTYECLSRNGFNYQGFFFMLQQQDLDKMKIEPLAQEALIRKLVRDFNGIRQSESCEGKKPRCPTAGEDNPYVEMENQNGAFYILPDVTANQTYMASRVSNN